MFTNAEYADILFIYGFCDGNARAAQREYQRRYPNRRVPNRAVFSGTYRRLAEHGNVTRRVGAGPVEINNEVTEEILERFEADPTLSTRQLAHDLGVSRWKVWSTVRRMALHPYHYTPVQGQHEQDPQQRVQFCRFLLETDIDDETFLSRILWTDESKFDRQGITNFHNLHYWAPENPHLRRTTNFQRRFSVNVWMGIIGGTLIGPHFFPDTLDGRSYEAFLRDNFEELLDDVPLANRQDMVFQHDGCPAHFYRPIQDLLNQRFPNRWIGRGGPIPWPARSPDLTPLDFYVWGTTKELVYSTEINTREELINRINNAAVTLRNNVTDRVTIAEIQRRYRACIRNAGGTFEGSL